MGSLICVDFKSKRREYTIDEAMTLEQQAAAFAAYVASLALGEEQKVPESNPKTPNG